MSILYFASCGEVGSRRPVMKNTNSFYKESVDRNKKLLGEEIMLIKKTIDKDSIHKYHNSEEGFWFAYLKKSSTNLSPPKRGDRVSFYYSVSTIAGVEIYSQQDIGLTSYLVGEEDSIFKGMTDLVNLMKQGEEVVAYFPSLIAYGYRGDGRKIGVNVPLKCHVSLTKINRKQ